MRSGLVSCRHEIPQLQGPVARQTGMQLLDPKLDVVFKLLFAHPNHRDILISLLTAVLQPTVPIADATVLNPEIPKDLPDDKGAVLDIRVQLADGRHIDVEMQAALHPGLVQRILYYWARLYGSQLSPGEAYGHLCPCISIVFLNARLLPAARFHGTFRVLEVHDHLELTDALELHLIELPKLGLRDEDPRLARWVRFLLAESETELQELAMNDAEMRRAKEALDQLSQDPAARELARERELARANLAIIRGFEREEGRQEGRVEGQAEGHAKGRVEGQAEGHAKGRVEGRAEGHATGLRLAIESLCDVLEIELADDRRQFLAQLSEDGLQDLLDRIRRDRCWPDSG